MTTSEFTTLLTSQIDKLAKERIIHFSLGICERLFPDYLNFSNKHNWGDTDILKDVLEFCQKSKENDIEKERVKEFIRAVDPLVPDTEDFGDWDGSYALNAG